MRKEVTPVIYNSAALKVLHFRVPANTGCFRTHWHDRLELLRIRQGSLFVGQGSAKERVMADTLVLFPPHVPHGGYTGDEAVEYDVLMFDVRTFYNETPICKDRLTALYENGAAARLVSADPALLACMDILCGEEPEPMAAVAEVYRLLALLVDWHGKQLPAGGTKDTDVRQFTAYLEEHSDQELSLEELSALFGYSKAHFCRKFKAFTGLAPMQYLKIVRVEHGYKLLRDGEQSVSKAAARCGFSDANYFTRCFKEHFGFPPSQARKKG